MIKFTAYETSTGRVLYSGTAEMPKILARSGELVFEGEAHSSGWLDAEKKHHAMPVQPSPHHAFNWTAKVWSDPRQLLERQDAQWAEVRAARNAQEQTSFPYMGKQIDSDLVSVLRINTVVKAAEHALANQREFAIAWTCADNSALDLNAQGMIGMPLALAAYAGRLHDAGAALKLAIYAEENLAALADIKWNPDV